MATTRWWSIIIVPSLLTIATAFTTSLSQTTLQQHHHVLLASSSKTNIYSKKHGKDTTLNPEHVVESSARSIIPHNVTLNVLYEDDDMLVINKPSGMIMQFVPGSVESAVLFYLKHKNPASSSSSSSSSSALVTWPWKSPESFEGIVHRIDKETSGILVLAKHPTAAIALHAAFQDRQVHKRYLAIAVGLPTKEAIASLETAAATGGTNIDDDNNISSPLRLHVAEAETSTDGQKLLSKQIKKCGRDTDKAFELLKDAVHPSAINFNSAMNICKRAGDRNKALAIFDSMKERNVKPNVKSFLKAINLCAKKPPLYQKAIELVGYMEECGIPVHPNCISPAISACGHAGQIEPILELLRLLEADKRSNDPNGRVGCFKAAISACEMCGESNYSLSLKEQLRIMMSDNGVEDSENTNRRSVDLLQADHLEQDIIVNAPIGRFGTRRRLMGIQTTDQGGRDATSIVSVLGFDGTLSLNSIVIETGRTHQIRVHMASMLGCPLAGDHMYNDDKKSIMKGGAERCMLHATELTVPHPMTGDLLTFHCPPPTDFSLLSDALSLRSS